jgi:hypothetical protein
VPSRYFVRVRFIGSSDCPLRAAGHGFEPRGKYHPTSKGDGAAAIRRRMAIGALSLVLCATVSAAAPCTWERIVSSQTWSCGLRYDGSVRCWGGFTFDDVVPPEGVTFTKIAVGHVGACGLDDEQELHCWGGIGYVPVGKFVDIDVDFYGGCALDAGGKPNCFSVIVPPPSGTFVQLDMRDAGICGLRSDGSIDCTNISHWPPAGKPFQQVSVGRRHVCALDLDGHAECTGDELWHAPTPDDRFVELASAMDATCGRKPNGHVVCWGDGFESDDADPEGEFESIDGLCGVMTDGTGQCWGSTDAARLVPDEGFAHVSIRLQHLCGIRDSGVLTCWGANSFGESVPPHGIFRSVASGAYHSCGVDEDGALSCWGANDEGQASVPAGTFLAVTARESTSCALTTSGHALCWGASGEGQADPGCAPFASISLGSAHGCGLTPSGEVRCWGGNEEGQASPPPGSFLAVAAGGKHTCAIEPDGELVCWGDGYDGQGGLRAYGPYVHVSAGQYSTCAVRQDGALHCWGLTSGPDGIVKHDRDARVAGRTMAAGFPYGQFRESSINGFGGCGVRGDGSIDCWDTWLGRYESCQPLPCGDGDVDDAESCDDGSQRFSFGDWCTARCALVPCAQPVNPDAAIPRTSDALYILRTAVGTTSCDVRVCDVTGDGVIVASDARRTLRAAVGLSALLRCPD